VPFDRSFFSVQRDQVTVGRGQVYGVLVNSRAAMADVERVVGRVLVMPEFFRGVGIDGPEVIRRRYIKDAVHQNRRRLDSLSLARLESPNLPKLADIFRRNRCQAGMPLTGIITVISEPAILRRVEQ